MATRAYPVERPPDDTEDDRFTVGLMLDIVDVLTRHGYPTAFGTDCVDLQQVLFKFIYGPVDEA